MIDSNSSQAALRSAGGGSSADAYRSDIDELLITQGMTNKSFDRSTRCIRKIGNVMEASFHAGIIPCSPHISRA